jgi:hypothetical protein
VHDDVGTRRQPGDGIAVADVSAQFFDGSLEAGIVERDDVERSNLMPVGEQPPREMQAEEARPA